MHCPSIIYTILWTRLKVAWACASLWWYSLSTGYEIKYEVTCCTTVTMPTSYLAMKHWFWSQKLSSSVTEGGTLLPDVLTGNWAMCLLLLHTMLDWGEDECLVVCGTWGSTETVKWLERFIVLLVQTTVVLYCLAMEYGATLFPVNTWQSLVASVSLYGSLRSWTWLCRTLKSLGTIKTTHRTSI